MNFVDFQLFRQQTLVEFPEIIDLAETNIWRSLSSLVPIIGSLPEGKVHRCHLAEAWLRLFQLPATWSQRAFITGGVRNSLSLLLKQFAEEKGTLLIPQDVYPVYGQLTVQAGIESRVFPTIPELLIPKTGRWLLIPNPLKPAGRWLSSHDVEMVLDWLSQDPARRVLIDAVYNFESRIHSTTLRIVETGQAFMLHSLSKAWLAPQVMGICLVPEPDWARLVSPLRTHCPEQILLHKAQVLMRDWHDLPSKVHSELSVRRRRVWDVLPASLRGLAARPFDGEAGYFFPIDMNFRKAMDQYGVLAIPLSVFGSADDEYSVVSSLSCVEFLSH